MTIKRLFGATILTAFAILMVFPMIAAAGESLDVAIQGPSVLARENSACQQTAALAFSALDAIGDTDT